MVTKCAPLVADSLFCHESDFMISFSDDNQADVIEALQTCWLYEVMTYASFISCSSRSNSICSKSTKTGFCRDEAFIVNRAELSILSSRKHLRTKVTPDFHLTYSKNRGNLGSESK